VVTEEERMEFWGDLVEPITALCGGLVVRGEFKLADVVRKMMDKAERAAAEEREAIAKMIEEEDEYGFKALAQSIRARGQS